MKEGSRGVSARILSDIAVWSGLNSVVLPLNSTTILSHALSVLPTGSIPSSPWCRPPQLFTFLFSLSPQPHTVIATHPPHRSMGSHGSLVVWIAALPLLVLPCVGLKHYHPLRGSFKSYGVYFSSSFPSVCVHFGNRGVLFSVLSHQSSFFFPCSLACDERNRFLWTRGRPPTPAVGVLVTTHIYSW